MRSGFCAGPSSSSTPNLLSRSYLSSGLVLLHVLASILGVCKALWDPLCFQPSAAPPPGGGGLSHCKSAVCSYPLHLCPVCCTAASSCLVSHYSPGYR
ncbi:unnamed protein product, partial [Staurois parvus]